MMMQMIGSFAEFERAMIRERTRAGLEAARAEGRIGGLTERFHGVPTTYSQKQTLEQDAPHIVRLCQEDQADVAVLVPI